MKLFHIPLLKLSTEVVLSLVAVGLWVVVIWQLPESERASTAAASVTTADISRDRFRTETVAIAPGATRDDSMQPEVATR
jgi:hypothetical protein